MSTKKPCDSEHRPAASGQSAPDEPGDPRAEVLEPQPDVLLYLEVPDELLKYYLSLSRASGMVYALAVKQLINRLYRDHDYVRRGKLEGRRTAYDTAVERDSQAVAWLIAAAASMCPRRSSAIPSRRDPPSRCAARRARTKLPEPRRGPRHRYRRPATRRRCQRTRP